MIRANSYDKVLWYSGAVAQADVADLAGLAVTGDRLTRLVLTFYKSNTSDAELKLDPAQDYRGTEEIPVYDDAACRIGPGQGSFPGALVWLFGLAILGRFLWRRAR